ncbi:MAG TPA: PfkB family carbohydrate kinase [Opitutaceae bacterium]|nr:PfkB family carbohydrate kinase [Opitutaceae bacterium]
MPHLFTLTANLLWEQTLHFHEWQPNRTQRATRATHQVGGKGINVAKMLARLGAAHSAICFPGGATGAVVEAWLRERGFALKTFPTATPETRSGVVIRSTRTETTFLGPDQPLDPAAVRIATAALATEPADAVLAVCGSIPGWDGPSGAAFRELFQTWRGPLVADTYGAPLKWLVERPLALVKINREEFDRLVPGDPGDKSELAFSMRLSEAAARWPVGAWIISDGPKPVWCALKDGAATALRPPPIREVSPTGSGDVLLAALLHAHFNLGQAWPDALAYALPFASANAAHEGIAEFPLPAS